MNTELSLNKSDTGYLHLIFYYDQKKKCRLKQSYIASFQQA